MASWLLRAQRRQPDDSLFGHLCARRLCGAYQSGNHGAHTETRWDSATVTIKPGIAIEKVRPKGKHVHVDLINYTDEAKTLTAITVTWPEDNGELAKIRLDGSMIWLGPGSFESQSGGRIVDLVGGSALILEEGNRETLRLEFGKKAKRTGYKILSEFGVATLDSAVPDSWTAGPQILANFHHLPIEVGVSVAISQSGFLSDA